MKPYLSRLQFVVQSFLTRMYAAESINPFLVYFSDLFLLPNLFFLLSRQLAFCQRGQSTEY